MATQRFSPEIEPRETSWRSLPFLAERERKAEPGLPPGENLRSGDVPLRIRLGSEDRNRAERRVAEDGFLGEGCMPGCFWVFL
jgi:hypothetical protein